VTGIVVKEGEPYESFIRRFRKTCERAGILKDYKRRAFYEKPSEKRRRRFLEAQRKEFRRRIRRREGY
jgi:small subunit ribosomal protein S21